MNDDELDFPARPKIKPNQRDDTNFIDDMMNCDQILKKCRESSDYCQRFYATLCNNEFNKGENKGSCSWRMAGGLVANIIKKGEYTDWYCSGNEGMIDPEVVEDILRCGWVCLPYEDNEVIIPIK